MDNKFGSFAQLQSKFTLSSLECSHYPQLQNLFSKYYSLTLQTPFTHFENICISSPRDKGLISYIYHRLNKKSLPAKSKPMLQWETYLDISFTSEEQNTMIVNLHKCNYSIAIRETAMKLHTRWYMTPLKLNSFYPSLSPCCYRGCSDQGSFLHIFWNCKFLQPFRQQTSRKISQLAG